MILALLVACTSSHPALLAFEATAGEQVVRCGAPFQVAETSVTIRDLRLFVHDVQLQGPRGQWVPLTLTPGPWQTDDGVALVDLEDGCHNGTIAEHRTLTGTTSTRGPYTGARLTIGVPQAMNHADPLTLPSPLTTTAMHWTWNAGFKFLRLDAVVGGEPTRLHLGSVGCEGPLGDTVTCSRPNRATGEVTFPPTDTPSLALELSSILAASTGGCMGNADEPGCAGLLAAANLDAHGQSQGPASMLRAR